MLYGPDMYSSDEDGLSDDNDYYEFKQKLNTLRPAIVQLDSEAEEKKRLKSIFSGISAGKENIVFEAIDKGLKIDTDLDLGWTPLLLASTTANPSLVSGLIERGADVNQSRDCMTPLMLLCDINQKDDKDILACVKLLVEKGADVRATDRKRKSAILSAASNGHIETVKFLLPLVDKEYEDNQRWNVLFYAVDGNHPKLVEFLLKEGVSTEQKDLRGNTVMDIAHSNGSQEILDFFPKDPIDEFFLFVSDKQSYFEDTFRGLKKDEKPQFFHDICKLLYATRSEQLASNFYDRKLTLFDFLVMTESKLEELGVTFPYQRKRIMDGIYKFHKHPFKPQTVPFIKKDQLYSNFDVATTLLTCIKQLIAMEASLKFMAANSEQKMNIEQSREVNVMICKTRVQINRLTIINDQLVRKSQLWDLCLKPADKIRKKRRNVAWSNLVVVGVAFSLIIFYKLK